VLRTCDFGIEDDQPADTTRSAEHADGLAVEMTPAGCQTTG